MEYQRIYTDLRLGKMSFADFMNVLGNAYSLGVETGVAEAEKSKQQQYSPFPLECESAF